MNIVKTAIEQAGGVNAVVSEHNQDAENPITYQAVWTWGKRKTIPWTDHTGKTNYSGLLVKLQRKNKTPANKLITRKALLQTRVA